LVWRKNWNMKEAGTELSDADFMKAIRMLATTALDDGDPMTRKHAIYMIGISRNPDCIPTLIRALKDPEKVVRRQAMQALVMIGRPSSRDLIELLKNQDWKVRYRAAEALGMLGDEKDAGPLIRMLSDNKDHVRYMAAKSLGMLRAPAARDPLRKCLSDENAYVRAMASSALSKIGN
jgi:HEAT repeat protein